MKKNRGHLNFECPVMSYVQPLGVELVFESTAMSYVRPRCGACI